MTDYLYGIHAISAVLQQTPQRITTIWVQQERLKQKRVQTVITLAEQQAITVHPLSAKAFEQRAPHDVTHQGVMAECQAMPIYHAHDLKQQVAQQLERGQVPFLLILDEVQDPHNLGACLRTANAAGAHGVVIPKHRSASMTAAVMKVASGAAAVTPVYQVTNLASALQQLRQQGVWVYGLTGEAPQSIFDADLSGPIALVLGNEASGLRRLTQAQCDGLFHIPMCGSVESLNVSVAAGIALYTVVQQRFS